MFNVRRLATVDYTPIYCSLSKPELNSVTYFVHCFYRF
jgi:hypothetical protein